MSGARHSAFKSPFTVYDALGDVAGHSPTLDSDVYEWAKGGHIEDADGLIAYDDRDEPEPDDEQVVQPESVPTAEARVIPVSSQAGLASFPGGVTL